MSPKVCKIIMYKALPNWINSIHKAPYEIILTQRGGVWFRKKSYPNLIHLYNHYYQNYMHILNHSENCLFLDYRKIIDKTNAMSYLNSKLASVGMHIQSEEKLAQILNCPTKKHGLPVTSADQALSLYDKLHKKGKYEILRRKDFQKTINPNIVSFFEKT